eukprot:CAMPEP_0203015710 /NCGR_PEP_ID=MMETSP1401-20130829/18385_1 /ASSEMBLY_ACC=CAM_ASM_000894 /TAXON_ID=38833 /ORGANISM="Micromonas pusilla, Strain CCAC1681" /LENGTH=137 /DNA_ID=CAMNT_0049757435 /DNA_START=13 /DNA_END=426 /DNA_ORIENTATION=+
MAASKTELRSRAKGKADAKAKDADAEDTKKDAVAGKTDAQGNLMDAAYYFKQYFGLALSIVAFGMVCFAGYAPKYGLSVNLFLYSSVVLGCVGLIFHETRPFKNQSTFAMDRETVEFARAQEAEAKIQADRAAKKKA